MRGVVWDGVEGGRDEEKQVERGREREKGGNCDSKKTSLIKDHWERQRRKQ